MATGTHFFRSLRVRLALWFIAVTMLSLIAVVTVLYFQEAAAIRTREFEKLQMVRDLKVRELTQWLEERTNDLRVAAGDGEIRALEDVLKREPGEWTAEDRDAITIARSHMKRYEREYGAYQEVFVVDAAGGKIVVSSRPEREGEDKQTDRYFTEVVRTRKPYLKDVYYSKIEGKPAMAFSTPVFCRRHDGEHLIAVLVARSDLGHVLYPLFQDKKGMGETGETLIVNRDMLVLNELRWRKDAPLKLKMSAEPALRAAAGETGIVEARDYRGEMVLAAYTHIPLTGWGFVAKRDLAEVYAPIRAMLRKMAAVVGIGTAVVLLVSLLLARSISSPIVHVRDTLRRFAEGDVQARCSTEGPDELAALGDSFNETAAALASQMAIRRGGAGISEAMAAAGDVDAFASNLLLSLLDITGSHLGAFYMRSEDGRTFEHVASVGLTGEAAASFSADGNEGELGKALMTGRISLIRDIPESTVFTFKTTAGTAIPREILTIPLVVEGRIMAVISLATLAAYSADHHQILEHARIGMNTALSNLLAGRETARMAESLQLSNEELVAVNEELQAQAEELREQTEELREQTEELRAQRVQIEEGSRLKSEFLTNMSHELRTPLNSIMSLSQLMLSKGVGKAPEKDAEHLRVIERNGRRLLALINDILDLSKIEAGRMNIVLSDFDPREVVERTVGIVRPMAEEKGLNLAVKIAEVPRMHSDEERIAQILLNLLANAVKFTERGEIALEVSATDDTISYAVRDTGIGISEKDLPHVFEEFRQADGSTTRRYEGTGLGLAICQKLAHILGGRITAESAVGQGSTFTLVLPLRCPAPLAATDAEGRFTALEPRRRPRRAGPAREKPLILVVEDNEVAALQVRSALEENGYVVSVAASGAEAIKLAEAELPDALILDVMMPEMDGFEVLDAVRSSEALADIPVLVLTAKELTAADHARLKRGNVKELVQKGEVDRDELVARVGRLLETDEPTAATTARASGRSRTVLVVEDNPDNLLAIKAILDSIGCECVIAGDGETAVSMAKEARPGLILMDIQLPGLSGLEAARRIKSDPAFSDIPIVALTARAMKGDREEILAAGCDGYLAKPLDAGDVIDAVREWLGIEGQES